MMCESQGNYEEAAEAFEKVIDLSKVQLVNHNISETGEASLFNLGHCYRKLQRLDDAIEMYKRALRCSPNKASTYTALAFTYHLMSDYDSAINYYHKVCFEENGKPNFWFGIFSLVWIFRTHTTNAHFTTNRHSDYRQTTPSLLKC